jgi:tetratricopeptide (TPR) repeat protein
MLGGDGKKGFILIPTRYGNPDDFTGYSSPAGCNVICGIFGREGSSGDGPSSLPWYCFPIGIGCDFFYLIVWLITGLHCCNSPPCTVLPVDEVFQRQCCCLVVPDDNVSYVQMEYKPPPEMQQMGRPQIQEQPKFKQPSLLDAKVRESASSTVVNCYNGGKNGVLQFILGDFDAASPHHGRFEGQLNCNHFTWGITVNCFKRVLEIMQWEKYERDPNHFATGEHNGYDLCEHIRAYMHKIGKPHLSLIEAIVSGEVEELLCLQSEVGPADGFFSHVQAVALASTMETLEDVEEKYEELLLLDRAKVATLRKKALEDFLREKMPGYMEMNPGKVNLWLETKSPEDIENMFKPDRHVIELERKEGLNPSTDSVPALASITAKKEHTRPRLFVDYFNIRQCIKNDFATSRLVDAIDTIGITLVELGADFRAESALLKRVFCVLELFATIKTKGELLVCGPVLGDAVATMELATVAADKKQCKEVMDSSSSRTRSAKAEAEIKAYIDQTIGFNRMDSVVLSAIMASCVRSAESAFAEIKDHGASVLHVAGCMLAEVGDYRAAQLQLEAALEKGEAAFGEGAFETAETVYMLACCHSYTDGATRLWFERSLMMNAQKHGFEHVATARSFVCMGRYLTVEGEYVQSLQSLNMAITRIEAADCPSDHADVHADALEAIGVLHFDTEEWQECLEWSEQSVRMRELKHGPDHVLATDALTCMAATYGQLGDPEKGMALYLRVLGIEEKARGRLTYQASISCSNIGKGHERAGRHSEAADWFKRALEAGEYSMGRLAGNLAEDYREDFKRAIGNMDPANDKTWEYKMFLEESEVRAKK